MPDSQQALDTLVNRLEPIARQAGLGPEATWRSTFDAVSPAAEPVYVSTIDRNGQLSCACTSSGMPWRMPGASSDVAVVGAGCFVDPDVGSAGSSGNAAANIKIAGAHTIIENMRMGMSPEEAGLAALRRVVTSMVQRVIFLSPLYRNRVLHSGEKMARMAPFLCGAATEPVMFGNLRLVMEAGGAQKIVALYFNAARPTAARILTQRA